MMASDLGDTLAAARVFDSSRSFAGRIGDNAHRERDVDLIGFKVPAGGTLTADVDAKSLAGGSTLDSCLRVFDASGRAVAFNDDNASSLDSFVSLVVPAAGTYYVGVSGFGNSAYNPRRAGSGSDGSSGIYSINVVVETAGDTIETARDLGRLRGGVTVRETIGGTDRSDTFRFTLTDRARVGIRLAGLASNADLALVDAGGQWITTSTQAGTTADLIERELRPGTYYAEVRPSDGTTSYTLTLSSQVVRPTFSKPEFRPTIFSSPNVYRSDSGQGWGFVDAAAAVARVRGLARPLPEVPYQPGDDPGIDLVNAPAVWAQGFTGAGVVVAVLDTGVDHNHPDLRQNIWVNPREIAGDGIDNDRNGFVDDVRGWDFVDNDAAPMDIVESVDWRGLPGNPGHGTHVAGTIAAVRNGIGSTGVAPDARIMPVRVLFNRAAEWAEIHLAIARGIRYAADNGAHVINMSLHCQPSSEVEQAIRHATSRGCVVVIAAGNTPDPAPDDPANLAATIDGVIAVGASEHDRSLASWSAKSGTDSRMQYVTAPGVAILSTLPGDRYGVKRGTSMAAPHVAGVAALMRSALPTASQKRYWAHITGTARQLPAATVRASVASPQALHPDTLRTMLSAAAIADPATRPRPAARGSSAAVAAHA